jgi:hypothetical protein
MGDHGWLRLGSPGVVDALRLAGLEWISAARSSMIEWKLSFGVTSTMGYQG